MNVSQILTDYLDGLANTRLALRSPSVLVPFVVFGLFQAVLLTLLAFFDWPPIAPVTLPLVRGLGGEPALHYPMHFVLLPRLWQAVYLPLAATLGFGLWTLAVWTMVDHHEIGQRIAARRFRSVLPHVLLVGVVFVAVSAGLGRVMGTLAGLAPYGPPARLALAGAILVVAGAQALLVYAPIVLRLRDVNALQAVRTSVRYALRNFWPTALVVATVLTAHMPLDAMISRSDRVALAFHPETVYYLLLGSVALEMVTAYVLFASVVGLALPEEGGLR
jgi:hypothetical protein